MHHYNMEEQDFIMFITVKVPNKIILYSTALETMLTNWQNVKERVCCHGHRSQSEYLIRLWRWHTNPCLTWRRDGWHHYAISYPQYTSAYMSTIPAFHQHNVKTITILWIWLYHPNCLVRQRSANWITAHCIYRQLHCRILPEWTEKCWITANSKVPLPYKVALPGGLKSIKPDHHQGSGNCGRGPTKYGHRRQKGGSKSNSEHAQWQFRTSGFSNFLFGVGQEYGLEDRREISISAIQSRTQTSETHVKKKFGRFSSCFLRRRCQSKWSSTINRLVGNNPLRHHQYY